MDNSVIKQIKDSIDQAVSIGIATPKNPSLDEMAASLGIYLLFKTANKNVSIASPEVPLVEVSSLVGIDKVQKSLLGTGGTGDLTVSFPYTEGEIEKVSYTQEEGFLNIIVKAGTSGLSFDENDVEFSRGGGQVDLVFTIGVDKLAELNSVFDTQNADTKIINIDNKEENERFGDINLVSSKLSSLSEGIADLALALGMHVDQDSAQNLLSGITNATNNFQSANTSSLAFEMASLLMKKGATREISESARRGITLDQPTSQTQRVARPSQRSTTDNKNFEETLQNRIQEEKNREQVSSGQPTTNQPVRPTQIENKTQTDDEAQNGEEAPTDWLSPKVYKGSSEV